jgi:beta-glucanase (GH16 family)
MLLTCFPQTNIFAATNAGAQKEQQKAPKGKLIGIVLDSTKYNLTEGKTHNTIVTAKYSDGTTEDVTSESHFSSSTPLLATVSKEGTVTGIKPGPAVLVVKYKNERSSVYVEVVSKIVTDWTLIWSEEFEGANGTAANDNNWVHELGNNGGWGNNELEYYTNSTDNVFNRDGNLVIKALKDASGQVTSGRIKTAGKFSMKYGKIDVRAKLPLGTGLWPAIWMMPANDVYGGWAASGEIDIMEAKGRLPEEVGGTLHYGGAWPNNKYTGKSYKFEDGMTIADFHTYSLEWEPGEIRWYVDGKLYQTQTNWYTANKDGEKYAFPAPFDQEFYVILNLAFGGNFDGGQYDESKLPGEMVVDYVHAYELTGRPYKTPVDPLVTLKPLPEGAKQPDSTGNLISNSDFSEPIVNNLEGLNDFGNAWNFVHIPSTGGNGTQSIDTIDGKNYAKIDISAPGSQNYAVQLIQRTTVGKGRWYKLSFDAKTSGSRKIDLKVGGGDDRGYAVYSDVYSYDLTDTFKHFESTFQMTADTDLKGRVEFELGLNTNTVWIGNVRLEEIPAPEVDLNSSKTPLPVSGNHVYNGSFDKASISRMTYWNLTLNGAKAEASVPEDTRELNVDITEAGTDAEAITLDQRGIQLVKDGQYRLNFKARAAADRNIKVKLVSKDGTVSYVPEKDFALTSEMKNFELPFTMSAAADMESQLVFMMGGSNSKVFIDDVVLVKTNVDYTGVDLYPLKNGDFSLGYTGWEQFNQGADAAFSIDNGAAKISATTLGSDAWNIMLIQSGMNFTKNVEYVLSFDARASVNRDILVTLENASYVRAFDSSSLQLTPQSKHFEYIVKPAVSESLALKFQMGRTSQGAAGDVYIDNVVLQVKNPPVKKAPMLIADDTDNMVGNAIDIAAADDAEWRNAITTVKINDNAVDKSKYELATGKITFAADNFTAAGDYIITVQAAGYQNAVVVQNIFVNDGSIVKNGTFDADYSNWNCYTNDGSDAKLSVENGELKVNFTTYDGWIIWYTQVYQDKLRLAAGKTYVIKFDARSTMAKNVQLELNKGTGGSYLAIQNIALTTSNQTFTYEVTMPVDDTNAKLNFLVGSNNVPVEQFIAHSIYLDNISIEEKVATPPADTAIVKNGTFDANYDGWTTYKADGSDAALSVENGELKVNFPNYDGWFVYSTQVNQEKLNLAAGKTYVLKFDARSTIAKNIQLELNKGAGGNYLAGENIALTTSNQTFAYEFTTTDADANATLKFLLGSNNVAGPNFAGQSIYLDNISIEEKTVTDGGNGGGGTTEPLVVTVEAENAAAMDAGFTVGTDAGISYLTASVPGTFSFDVNAPEAGTYKVTVFGKCVPAGVYYELRNSNNANIGSIGWAPSTDWVQATFNATLSEG